MNDLNVALRHAPDTLYRDLFDVVGQRITQEDSPGGFDVVLKEGDSPPKVYTEPHDEGILTLIGMGEEWFAKWLKGSDEYRYLLKWDTIIRLDPSKKTNAPAYCRCMTCIENRMEIDE
jgi:hypothetical protein